MRRLLRSTGVALGLPFIVALASSCVDHGTTRPTLDGQLIPVNAPHGSFFLPSDVRISELHYDNSGTDTGERIEITAPVGKNLSGWKLVLYNGSGGAAYNTTNLTGIVAASPGCPSGRGVVVVSYPTDGIQNGSPDGMALIGPEGVVEFLTYEGIFEAAGINGTDIGVSEPSTSSVANSLQRGEEASWFWKGPIASSFGSCNVVAAPQISAVTVTPSPATVVEGATRQFTAIARNAANQTVTGVMFTWTSSNTAVATVAPGGIATGVAPGDVTITATAGNVAAGSASLHVDEATLPGLPATRFSEIHYDNVGTDANEAIEIEGPAGTDVTGWQVVLYNGSGGSVYDSRTLQGLLPTTCTGRGVQVVTFEQDGIQNGPDGMALVNAAGQVVEFLSWEGTFTAQEGPAAGTVSRDMGVLEVSATIGHSLQRRPSGLWDAAKPSTFSGCYGSTPNPPVNVLTFSGRSPFDSPLPAGFEDQIFGNLRSPSNTPVSTTITWVALTPAVATIDADGVIHALAAGSAKFRGTADDGTTATYTLPTIVATPSTTAAYGNHVEFGEPTDTDASDDFILRRREFTSSFNRNRGIPNWVSYNLDATHMVSGQDRCDCFTFDPLLPADFQRYTTADYTGAGSYHGYSIDRGHLARSADRTAGVLDNATTFYFSNIIPQAADNNQGPWMHMENYLGSLAQSQNKELYIIAGASGSKGTVKNEGIITIPTHTWKVAVIMPRDGRAGDVDSFDDVEVIAVIMPNEPGLKTPPTNDDDNWRRFLTTVNAVETLSGYNLLALLADDVEGLLESGLFEGVAIANALASAGTITSGNATSLNAKLAEAAASLERGRHTAAGHQLRAYQNEVQAMERSGRLGSTDAAALRAIAQRVIDSL